MMRWREFFEEANGRLSSKRLAGLAAAFALDMVLVAQTVAAVLIAWRHPNLPAVPLDQGIVWAVAAVALGGLGLSSWEKHIKEKEETRRATVAMRAIPEDKP
mgnify:CR=1 FL=1